MTTRDIGLAVVRAAPWLKQVGRWIYARLPAFLHDTPTSRLRAHFAGEPRVTFVQIGAYDGVAGDPIRPVVVENAAWSGILIEPQHDAFERLKANYVAQQSRLQFLNAAISDSSGERTIFFIPEEERKRLTLPDWAGEIASFDAKHLAKEFPLAKLCPLTVRTMTFAEVADHLPSGHTDVVVLDVEGHERAIIETIDLDRHQVRFIAYEHKHLSDSDRSVVENKMRSHGFALKAFGRDTIAYRSLQPADGRHPRAGEEVVP